MRTALNLADVTVTDKASGAEASDGARRGQVVTLAAFGGPSRTCDVQLERSPRLVNSKSPAARPLKDGLRVQIHHGSANTPAHICLGTRKEVAPGEDTLAQLRFDSPVYLFAGDRFIVRDWAEQATLAGGIILDPDAQRKGFRASARQDLLRRRAEQPANAVKSLATELTRDRVVRRDLVLLKSNFAASEIAAAIDHLQKDGKAVVLDKFVALGSWWTSLRAQAIAAVDAHHKAHPEQAGLPLTGLRSELESEVTVQEVFELLLSDLRRSGFSQTEAAIKRSTHHPALPPQLQSEGTRLRAVLKAKPFEPPSRKELAPTVPGQQALLFLIRTGEAIELGDDVVLLSENYARAAVMVKEHLRQHGRATVSELRQVIGASRRIVVPLLERLDREGVTRRQGDVRVLKGS
jgi:selenocysteine-specific elongation factor